MCNLKINNNKVTVSSKVIAESFSKRHNDVLRAINNLDCSQEFRLRNFAQSEFTTPQNKKYPCFEISRDGFAFLAMGFTGPKAAEWKEKYINAFNEMESALIRGVKSDSIDDINKMLKGIEDLNQVGSVHGKGLAEYAKKKKARVLEYQDAVNSAQLVLNIK
jgi:Rha family phage regulatory protein